MKNIKFYAMIALIALVAVAIAYRVPLLGNLVMGNKPSA